MNNQERKERIEKIIDYWFALARTSKKSEWDELYSRNECIRNLIQAGLVFKDEVGIDEDNTLNFIVEFWERAQKGKVFADLSKDISTHAKDLLTFNPRKI